MSAADWRGRWPDIATVAAYLLARREASYPALITKGKLTAAEADAGKRIMAAIALQWRRAVACDPTQVTTATQAEMLDTLTTATVRAAREATRSSDLAARQVAEIVETMLWYQQPQDTPTGPLAVPRILFLVRTNAAVRARAVLPTRKAA